MITLDEGSEGKLLSLIGQQEGLRLDMYTDTRGNATFGYGCTFPLNLNEAEFIRNNRLSLAEMGLMKKLPWFLNLDTVRKIVLIDMAYNMGIDAVMGFRNMLTCAMNSNWKGAADEMLNSDWAKQLPSRAQQMAYIMETGAMA